MNFLRDLLATVRLSDDPMTDLMVDSETTGTNPYSNAMIQLAAIPFNYETGAIGQPFNRCLNIPKNRFWDEDTRKWWGNQPHVLESIFQKMEDPKVVTQEFWEYVCRQGGPLRFWSRGSFDWWFVQSYMDQYELQMPFRFDKARDLRSFQSALRGTPDEPDMSWLTHPGDAHNALYDCVVQLKRLFSARDGVFYEILPPEENAA